VSGLANKKRESVFTRHPDGAKIAEMVYNKEMTQKRAAEILGCSIPNISLYMKKHFPKHTPDKSKRLKKKPPSPGPESDEPVLVIKLASDATNLEWGSSAWKLMLQNLTQSLMDPHLIVEDQVKLMNALIKLLQFQFKEKDLIPEYKALTVEKQLKRMLTNRAKSDFFLQNPHLWADERVGIDLYEKHTLRGSKWRGWGEHQVSFLRDITDLSVTFQMGICNRGGSKTWLTAIGLCCLLDNVRGIRASVLSGSFKQAKTCYKYARDILNDSDG